VVQIDSFGNLLTNIPSAALTELSPAWESLQVKCKEASIAGLVTTYAAGTPGSLVALFGSSGRLELAIVEGNAAVALSAARGASVIVSW
jgi:S-adenosylmethionine hydrolase